MIAQQQIILTFDEQGFFQGFFVKVRYEVICYKGRGRHEGSCVVVKARTKKFFKILHSFDECDEKEDLNRSHNLCECSP